MFTLWQAVYLKQVIISAMCSITPVTDQIQTANKSFMLTHFITPDDGQHFNFYFVFLLRNRFINCNHATYEHWTWTDPKWLWLFYDIQHYYKCALSLWPDGSTIQFFFLCFLEFLSDKNDDKNLDRCIRTETVVSKQQAAKKQIEFRYVWHIDNENSKRHLRYAQINSKTVFLF